MNTDAFGMKKDTPSGVSVFIYHVGLNKDIPISGGIFCIVVMERWGITLGVPVHIND